MTIKNLKPNLPQIDDEFGHYLAGLMDGDGYFGPSIRLCFNIHDIPLCKLY